MTDQVRILVVDDSRLVRMALARNLKGTFDVREEGDGEAAWQQLLLDHSIRAVLSDLQMPKLAGAGLLQRVRASKPRRLQEMPFIVVSGEETEEERERVRVLGASAYAKEGATEIIASRGTWDLIVERGHADMKSAIERFPRLFAGAESVPGLTWPTMVFERELTLHLGTLEVKLMHIGPGHTLSLIHISEPTRPY